MRFKLALGIEKKRREKDNSANDSALGSEHNDGLLQESRGSCKVQKSREKGRKRTTKGRQGGDLPCLRWAPGWAGGDGSASGTPVRLTETFTFTARSCQGVRERRPARPCLPLGRDTAGLWGGGCGGGSLGAPPLRGGGWPGNSGRFARAGDTARCRGMSPLPIPASRDGWVRPWGGGTTSAPSFFFSFSSAHKIAGEKIVPGRGARPSAPAFTHLL